MAEDADGGLPHLAERLDALFARVPRPDGAGLYNNERAAEDLRAMGVSVTGAYLAQLRGGRRNNPSARLLAAIAELFGVPISYFHDQDQARRIEAELDVLVALKRAGVRSIVARSAGVSDAGLANLAAILEQLRRMEGLDDD